MLLLTLCRWLVVASSFTEPHQAVAPVAGRHVVEAPKGARRPARKPTRSSPTKLGLEAIGCAGLVYGLAFGRRRVGSSPARALAEEHGAGGEPVDEVLAADRPDLSHREEPSRGDRPE
jgi:hypothetical protein